jgi:putative sterol carrier protein
MAGLADREAAKGVSEAYQFLVGESAFYFTVDDGSIELHDGRAQDPAVVVSTDEKTWARLAAGKIRYSAASDTGALSLAGDRQAEKRFRKIFSREHMLAQGSTR